MMKEESNYQELLIILLCQRYTQIIFHGEKIKYRLVTKSTAETTSLFTSSPQWSLHWIFFWRIFSSIMSFLAMHKMFCGLEGNTKIKCFQKFQNVTFTSKNKFEYNFYHCGKKSSFRYGASGTIVKIDAMCLLPLNILNDKIYLFLSFW